MNIKGIHKTSLIDYPGRISTVLFSGGCNLKCRYCHNPEIVLCTDSLEGFSNDEAISFINKRRDIIDGVALSGGEPTLSKNLIGFIRTIKKMSLPVKIDTNGLNPAVIEGLLNENLLDYVAIDIKTSPEKYEELTGSNVDFSLIKKTIDILKSSFTDYELRTTCIPYFVELADFIKIKDIVGFVKRYYIQQFVNKVTLDTEFGRYIPYPLYILKDFQEYVSTFSEVCEIRGI